MLWLIVQFIIKYFLRKSLIIMGFICLILANKSLTGQHFYRIESDISIKSKVQGGEGSLTVAKVYYDKTIKKLVYDISFPEREVWVVEDSHSRIYRDGILYQDETGDPFVETTLFHKCLDGSLNDFGLRNSPYQIEKVERDGNMVITTWNPPQQLNLGQILTSMVNNTLYGVIMKNSSGNIVSRQLYENYSNVGGLKVPTEITQVMYTPDGEVYQVITLSNIVINSVKNENMYNYSAGSH
jgi:hypothetical protein